MKYLPAVGSKHISELIKIYVGQLYSKTLYILMDADVNATLQFLQSTMKMTHVLNVQPKLNVKVLCC